MGGRLVGGVKGWSRDVAKCKTCVWWSTS